jgi:hypothetical protein
VPARYARNGSAALWPSRPPDHSDREAESRSGAAQAPCRGVADRSGGDSGKGGVRGRRRLVSDIEVSARLREQLCLPESGRRVLSPCPDLQLRDVPPFALERSLAAPPHGSLCIRWRSQRPRTSATLRGPQSGSGALADRVRSGWVVADWGYYSEVMSGWGVSRELPSRLSPGPKRRDALAN